MMINTKKKQNKIYMIGKLNNLIKIKLNKLI